jgi:hypothetical protein
VMPIADTQIMSTVAHMNTLISYDCECAATKKKRLEIWVTSPWRPALTLPK